MISRQTLAATGSIGILTALIKEGDQTTDELGDAADVAKSTVRKRLNDLSEEGLVEDDAQLRNEDPTRVYNLTSEGQTLATSLQGILDDEDEPKAETANAKAASTES